MLLFMKAFTIGLCISGGTMTRILAVGNQMGGVGKITTALHLGAEAQALNQHPAALLTGSLALHLCGGNRPARMRTV
jgi:hypothetical protein